MLAKQGGLYPADNWEAAHVDALLDALEETSSTFGPSFREQDPEKKKAMREALLATTLPQWVGNIEKHLAALNASGWSVGNSISIADLKLFQLVQWIKSGTLDHIPTTFSDAYPRITAIHTAVGEHDKVKAYYAAKAGK